MGWKSFRHTLFLVWATSLSIPRKRIIPERFGLEKTLKLMQLQEQGQSSWPWTLAGMGQPELRMENIKDKKPKAAAKAGWGVAGETLCHPCPALPLLKAGFPHWKWVRGVNTGHIWCWFITEKSTFWLLFWWIFPLGRAAVTSPKLPQEARSDKLQFPLPKRGETIGMEQTPRGWGEFGAEQSPPWPISHRNIPLFLPLGLSNTP